jgi:BirA family biotin operon repressor/biotin-[acetyl-CoA-carboxylase] ligase
MHHPQILVFDELDSTNAEARRRAEAGGADPVWLMARRQTAGRGRRGRAWDGGQGNLTATLLLTLDKPPLQAAQLAFVAALAVGEAIDAYVSPEAVSFKWPNDVLIAHRKAAGILIESGKARAGGLWIAIGVGLNLATYPVDVERPATALADHGAAPTPEEALERLAQAFARRLSLWLEQGLEPIREAWLERAVGMGAPCIARLASETVQGVAEGLDADGALLIRLPDGAPRRILAGDVFFGAC